MGEMRGKELISFLFVFRSLFEVLAGHSRFFNSHGDGDDASAAKTG